MMHGFGMGGFGLLWILVPLVLTGTGVVAILAARRRLRRTVGSHEPDGELEVSDGGFARTVFRLARERGGELTVSDVVVETGASPRDVEAEMDRLVDGSRVVMTITGSGGIRYEFPELRTE